jgi:hypothetical protein
MTFALQAVVMDGVVQIEAHLRHLQQRVSALNSSFMSEMDAEKRNAIQRELHALQIAIEHYRAALKAERTLNGSK